MRFKPFRRYIIYKRMEFHVLTANKLDKLFARLGCYEGEFSMESMETTMYYKNRVYAHIRAAARLNKLLMKQH